MLRVGPFIADLTNVGTVERPVWRYWARRDGTVEDAAYGLSPHGYSSAVSAAHAMEAAKMELEARHRDETPTEEMEDGCRQRRTREFRDAITEKLEAPWLIK